jgi:hypothetical protein
VFSAQRRLSNANQAHRFVAESPAKYWEIIADNLSKAGWSWGCVSAVDARGRTIFVADAIAATKSVSSCERMKS